MGGIWDQRAAIRHLQVSCIVPGAETCAQKGVSLAKNWRLAQILDNSLGRLFLAMGLAWGSAHPNGISYADGFIY